MHTKNSSRDFIEIPIFFIPVAVVVACILCNFSQDVVAVSALTLSYGLIGWLDDWQILRRKSNKGISPKTKLALQVIFGALFCFWLMLKGDFSITNIHFLAEKLKHNFTLFCFLLILRWLEELNN